MRKYTIEGRRKLSEARKGKRTGMENPNWRGGSGLCIDCKGSLSIYAYPKLGIKRCKKCYAKQLQIPEEKWNWKGGISKTREYKAHYSRIKRDRLRGATGSHTLKEWQELKDSYGKCLACGATEPDTQLTRDHIIPIARGGSNNIENIQPLCRSCNSRKYTKVVSYLY